MIGTMCFIMPPLLLLLPLPALTLLGGTSSCDEDEEDDRKVRLWSLWLMPESGEVVQLVDEGGASSFDRRVLSSSVDANATNRSNPELTRSCQLDSSSPTSSVVAVVVLRFYTRKNASLIWRKSTLVQEVFGSGFMGVQSEVEVAGGYGHQ